MHRVLDSYAVFSVHTLFEHSESVSAVAGQLARSVSVRTILDFNTDNVHACEVFDCGKTRTIRPADATHSGYIYDVGSNLRRLDYIHHCKYI
jgi:hypothetical protein